MSSKTQTTAAKPILAAVAVLVCAASLFHSGCKENAPPATGTVSKSAARPADKVYQSRGRITMLPAKDRPTAELVIQHEAIDDFLNPGGRMGMASMEMPLPPDKSIVLSDFAKGDIVEFDLAVWYTEKFASIESYRVTRMKKLPADTQLHFGPAAPTPGAKNP